MITSTLGQFVDSLWWEIFQCHCRVQRAKSRINEVDTSFRTPCKLLDYRRRGFFGASAHNNSSKWQNLCSVMWWTYLHLKGFLMYLVLGSRVLNVVLRGCFEPTVSDSYLNPRVLCPARYPVRHSRPDIELKNIKFYIHILVISTKN